MGAKTTYFKIPFVTSLCTLKYVGRTTMSQDSYLVTALIVAAYK